MPKFKSSQDSLNQLSPVSCTVNGTAITTALGSAHSCNPQHDSRDVRFYRGASLLKTGTNGLLAVHLVDDPVGTWYLLDLIAGGGVFPCVFDLVGDSDKGTTVTLDGKMYIYPGMYSNEI